ncbi:MAG: restriction endonuclease subunit S [Parvibaculaceae bacterium]|uniref:restriction endonuclease subunit S n=1 Tax=Parvibaculum sp. TaxID=2024848 RepID=UPI0032EF1632
MAFGADIKELVQSNANGLIGAHETWERVRVGEIAGLKNGFPFKSNGFNESDGTPLLRIRDVLKGVPGTRYRGMVDDPAMTFVEDGEIVVGMDGDFNSRLWRGGKALLNQRVCSLLADERFYSQKFLSYVLPGYLKLVHEHTSSVTVKHLSSLTVLDIPLPLPPRSEQERIVEKIDTLFARLDKGEEVLRAIQKLLARYRQSVLKAAVTGELTADWRAENAHRLEDGRDLLEHILKTRRENWSGRGKYKEPVAPDTAGLPELPEGWVWASPEQLSSPAPNSLCIGPFGSNLKVDDYREEGVPLVFVRHIRAKNFSGLSPKFVSREKAQELRSHKVDPGDILITKMGEPPGDVCIYPFSAEAAVITADCIKMSPPKVGVSVGYLELALSSDVVQSQIRKISKGVAQQKVNLANFKRIAIPLPPLPLQEMIEHSVAERLSKLAVLEEWCDTEVDRSSALRQSILKNAFSGRLVDQDPSDEPASELLARVKAAQTTAKKTKRGKAPA